MLTLHELQCRFRDALLSNDSDMVEAHIQVGEVPVPTRLGIYRNNVFTNLRETLRTIYPVINKLVGKEFFSYAADTFIQRYPSPAGDLNRFGEYFGAFLADFAPAAELVYLPDTARLEWLTHQTYHAAEVMPLDRQALGSIAPDDYGRLLFSLNPACALLASEYPVHRIWQVNQTGYTGDPSVDLASGSVRLLILRHGNFIELQPLADGEWVLLNSLAIGENFAQACCKTLQVDPEFDVGHCLCDLVEQAALVGFRLGGADICES